MCLYQPFALHLSTISTSEEAVLMVAGTVLLAPIAPGMPDCRQLGGQRQQQLSHSRFLQLLIVLLQLKSRLRGFQAKNHKNIIVPKVDLQMVRVRASKSKTVILKSPAEPCQGLYFWQSTLLVQKIPLFSATAVLLGLVRLRLRLAAV